MKRAVAALVAGLALAGTPAAQNTLTTGRELLPNAMAWLEDAGKSADGIISSNDAARFQGFVSGVLAAAAAQDGVEVPETLNITERCAIVAAFLRDNPDRLDERATELIVEAIRRASP